MTGRKNRDQSKAKGYPKSEPPPETAKKPKGDPHSGSTDEGNERATGREEKGFDPNVNQRPPR
jgi:hypothetical protein